MKEAGNRLIYLIYNVFLLMLSPLLILWWIFSLIYPKYRIGWRERLGFLPPKLVLALGGKSVIWIHAVSVGEVNAAIPLIRKIKENYPSKALVISTVTVTGQQNVKFNATGLDGHFYFPFDIPWIVKRVLKQIHPELFIFFETELWPNLLNRLKQESIPSVLVNGRISDPSFRRYSMIKSVMKMFLKNITISLMQSEMDREKFVALGGIPETTFTTGNTKYDQIHRSEKIPFQEYPLLTQWEWWIAGSTHAKEEEMILNAYLTLRDAFPKLGLMLAPRHPDRWNEVSGLLLRLKVPFLKRSELVPGLNWGEIHSPVILLDTIGELPSWYYWATIALVGGSLVPKGGHNILETAIWGKAPFFGPFMENFKEMAELFKEKKAGIEISGEAQLVPVISQYLRDRSLLEVKGKRAAEVLFEKQGASERSLAFMARLIR